MLPSSQSCPSRHGGYFVCGFVCRLVRNLVRDLLRQLMIDVRCGDLRLNQRDSCITLANWRTLALSRARGNAMIRSSLPSGNLTRLCGSKWRGAFFIHDSQVAALQLSTVAAGGIRASLKQPLELIKQKNDIAADSSYFVDAGVTQPIALYMNKLET